MRARHIVVIATVAVALLAVFTPLLLLMPEPWPVFTYTDTTTPENLTSSISVNAGETFVIHLSSNPSTGYDWQVKTSDSIKFLNYTSTGAGAMNPMPGSAVERDYSFQATKTGPGTITLVYERAPPAFAKEQILKTIQLSVSVG